MHDTTRNGRRGKPSVSRRHAVNRDSPVVYETITLCQPDRRKSCTACCGLFNFRDISREHLEKFLAEGAARSSTCMAEKDMEDCGNPDEVRDPTSYICPHQGLLYNMRPGCLIHPYYRNVSLRSEAFFGESICDGFTCPAHTLLEDDEKRILVDLLDDWYRYTIAIIDPSTTSWLITYLKENHPSVYHSDSTMKLVLDECLMIHACSLGRRRGPVFFYSQPEYEAGKREFALACDGEAGAEFAEIIAAVRRYA